MDLELSAPGGAPYSAPSGATELPAFVSNSELHGENRAVQCDAGASDFVF